jgi:2-dehydro-3-deoxyphosphooctonate aldolase (KDO 8-P synthase)
VGKVVVGDIELGEGAPLFLIAGPCVIEDETRCLDVAVSVKEIANRLNVPLIFKASYDKANRTSITSFRGPGIEAGLRILSRIKEELGIPVTSDVHSPGQVERAAELLDVIQVPAFLSRQTDLLLAAGKTGKVVNIKKGQFIAPWDMVHAVEKVRSTGNDRIVLTERGSSFGYNNLVSDMRSIPVMKRTGCPVVFDATHSVQLPGAAGGRSGGERDMVSTLALAAVAAGADGLFVEVHQNPDEALCDAPNTLAVSQLEPLLQKAKAISEVVK